MKKILIIDDEPDISEALQGFLEISGYMVLTAARAVEAMTILELERPKVVILDVVMPDMDGIECLKSIRKNYPETIVIVVSGLQNESIAKEAIRYGAYDYVAKPYDFHHLQNNILRRIF